MIAEFYHKINEKVVIVKEQVSTLTLTIRRISDGYYFNNSTSLFEAYNAANASYYTYPFVALFDTTLVSLTLATLPDIVQDLLFTYTDNGIVTWERHIFGGTEVINSPSRCIIYGTLLDVSGAPISNQPVKADLNRAGYFVSKSGIIGEAASTLTDETGYFELPLVTGLDVTINIPIIGFSVKGYVPSVASVELTSQALLSYVP